jgi:exodeoxyribonuclease VII small subunit
MPKKVNDKPSYQTLSRQLDEVVAKMQDPEVPIDDAARYYEQAMQLIGQLEEQLEHAEIRVREIKARFNENE